MSGVYRLRAVVNLRKFAIKAAAIAVDCETGWLYLVEHGGEREHLMYNVNSGILKEGWSTMSDGGLLTYEKGQGYVLKTGIGSQAHELSFEEASLEQTRVTVALAMGEPNLPRYFNSILQEGDRKIFKLLPDYLGGWYLRVNGKLNDASRLIEFLRQQPRN